MKKNTCYAILIILFISFLPACQKGESQDVTRIKQVIRWHNEELIRVYKDLDPKSLNGLASPKEIGRVNMIIMKFKADKVYMESEMKSLEFVKIDLKTPEMAEVETKESWRFRHLKTGTNVIVRPWSDKEYKMRFKMVNREGKWLVAATEIMK